MEASSLAELLGQFRLGDGIGAALRAAKGASGAPSGDARATQSKVAEAVKSFPVQGNAALKAESWEEF